MPTTLEILAGRTKENTFQEMIPNWNIYFKSKSHNLKFVEISIDYHLVSMSES